MRLWIGIVCALAIFTVSSATSQDSPRTATTSEQMQFSAGGHVQEAVPIPADVLPDLKQDKLVKAISSQVHADVGSLLAASAVHLNSSDERDLVVIGQGDLVSHGSTVFWIYRPSPTGYEMIFTSYGSELIVKNSRTKGYRDLMMVTPNGQQLHRVEYRFDGQQYVVASETY